ncbi:DUF6503 family protein [Winogradskyella alexanderae]|uniref:Deoxyribose-phosphate aldolase n=1 Tax=Winogradskyella alexanderae TaxID=2877123 RepID=A0ABS7XSU3_9FLAO|nr:DUF6503 family protein [Winogradskyella alexanderae]MCA0133099.1 deoxyribose-phosphate aldolase [Winogradskyella alexanderae]
MKHTIYLLLLLLLFFCCFSCSSNVKNEVFTAQEIIDKAIEESGGSNFNKSNIRFDFRDKSYFAKRDKGKFLLGRSFVQDSNSITDYFTNSEFQRLVDNRSVEVADSLISKYKTSINSVHYFAKLPHGLNDPSVNKVLIGEETIKGETYFKIRVTFNEVGGGEDFDDVFFYWINKKNWKTEYLAYSYNEDDGKGMRFREAYNERYIKGIRFLDYNNYRPKDSTIKLIDLGKNFEKNKLNFLSKIELKNIEVDLF